VLLGLFTLALVLRLWELGGMPPGLDTDEASIGYNAFSLLHTGRDEFGEPWPLAFRAFGEYKRPVYIYATLPSIAALGLTPLAVRLPAALAGALAVLAMYAVASLLLGGGRRALWAAGLLAVSPWHLQFSRAAREVSLLILALLVMVAALLAALRFCRASRAETPPHRALAPTRAGLLLLLAALAFLAAVYSYPGGVIVTPLLALLVIGTHRARLARVPRVWAGAAVAVLVLGCLPLGQQFADGRARARYAATSVLTNPAFNELVAQRQERDRRDGAAGFLSHPQVVWAGQALLGYTTHFDPSFLFTRGDPEPRHRSVTGGQLHLWDLPMLLAGALLVARQWRRPAPQIVLGWLAIGALPAAFAVPVPHAVRSIPMLPAWYLLGALGAVPVWRWLARHRFAADWALALVLSVGLYLSGYYRDYRYEADESWASGWLETFRLAQAQVDAGHVSRVVVPPHLAGSAGPAVTYIYALFATAYSPQAYLAQGGSPADPERGPLHFRPFELRGVDWTAEPRRPHTLYLYPPHGWLPAGAHTVAEVRGVSGRAVVRLIAFSDQASSAADSGEEAPPSAP
jgi:4-amino-4-deoxy-L-arabinose transferase-like glycosyltransferase